LAAQVSQHDAAVECLRGELTSTQDRVATTATQLEQVQLTNQTLEVPCGRQPFLAGCPPLLTPSDYLQATLGTERLRSVAAENALADATTANKQVEGEQQRENQDLAAQLQAQLVTHRAEGEAHQAVLAMNADLKARVASLENVLRHHDVVAQTADARAVAAVTAVTAPIETEIEKLVHNQAEARESLHHPTINPNPNPNPNWKARESLHHPTITKIQLDGAALRKRAAERIERGDLQASLDCDNEATMGEIKASKYPLNLSARLLEASTTDEPPQATAAVTEAEATEQRKTEREARLASITASWDTEVSVVQEDPDAVERRAKLVAATQQASLTKHMDAMANILNQS
jgi:hypothetical protein